MRTFAILLMLLSFAHAEEGDYDLLKSILQEMNRQGGLARVVWNITGDPVPKKRLSFPRRVRRGPYMLHPCGDGS